MIRLEFMIYDLDQNIHKPICWVYIFFLIQLFIFQPSKHTKLTNTSQMQLGSRNVMSKMSLDCPKMEQHRTAKLITKLTIHSFQFRTMTYPFRATRRRWINLNIDSTETSIGIGIRHMPAYFSFSPQCSIHSQCRHVCANTTPLKSRMDTLLLLLPCSVLLLCRHMTQQS